MSGIRTGIELQDNFTDVMDRIINSVNVGVQSMDELQQTMNQNVNTSTFHDVRSEIDATTAAVGDLQSSLNDTVAPTVSMDAEPMIMDVPERLQVEVVPVVTAQPQLEIPNDIQVGVTPVVTEQPQIEMPDDVTIPVTPTIIEQPQMDVNEISIPVNAVVENQPQIEMPDFDSSGVQRFSEQVQTAENLLQSVSSIQQAITNQSQGLTVIPDAVKEKITDVNSTIARMQQALSMIQNNPFSMDSQAIEQQIISVTNELNHALEVQRQLSDSLSHMDIEVEQPPPIEVLVEPQIPKIEPIQIPVEWQSDNLDVFTNSGIERFEQEIQSTNSMLNELTATQYAITQQANESEILPPNASYDIQNLENRLNSLQGMIQSVESTSLDIGSDEANTQLERLRVQMNQLMEYQDNLNQAMQSMDVGNINDAYMQLSRTISSTERYVRDSFSEPLEIPVTWNTDNVDVFTGTGVDRFRQEVSSTNDMLNTLNTTQAHIQQTASGMDILPDAAVSDITTMGQRLQMIQQHIQQIENNPVNIGTDTANSELEQLRSQLNQALSAQNTLNSAMQNMDISGANTAYMNLSQAVGNTERYIRDNVDEQGRFNQEIQEGTNQADDLMNTIKGAVAAYISIQSVGKALNISDELTMTTSRLDMMNDGLQDTQELTNMVYAAAQDSRGSFSEMANVVARFGNNAKDAFGSSEEVVAFANLIQKQMTIAGAGTQEASNAMLQLSQALGSGVLRGDELNSIFEQAPNLIQSIADYLDVPIGQIREMAGEGELSADIVKAAIFDAADDINAKFEQMPMTWGQVWQSMQNTAMMAFQPVLQRLNDIANSEAFQSFVNGAIEAMATLANVVLNIFDVIGQVGGFIADNWSIIEPVVLGVAAAMGIYTAALIANNIVQGISAAIKGIAALQASVHAAALMMESGATFTATAAQYGFNTALLACPITWIILLIIALIAIIFAVCSAIAHLTGVANSGFGVITGGINVVIQFFKNLGLSVANIALGIGSAIGALASNMMAAFSNAISSVQAWFYDLLSTACNVIAGIAEALNKLPFVEFDYSGIASEADDYAAKSAAAAGNKEEYASISDAFNSGMSTFDTFQDGWATNAFNAGASWGDGIAEKVSDFSLSDIFGSTDLPKVDDYTPGFDDAIANSGIGDNLGDIAGDTGAIKDGMEITNEDLKYLRDIAEQEGVNRFTTAEIKIEQTNNNNVSGDMDLDGIVQGLSDAVDEATEIIIGKGD